MPPSNTLYNAKFKWKTSLPLFIFLTQIFTPSIEHSSRTDCCRKRNHCPSEAIIRSHHKHRRTFPEIIFPLKSPFCLLSYLPLSVNYIARYPFAISLSRSNSLRSRSLTSLPSRCARRFSELVDAFCAANKRFAD